MYIHIWEWYDDIFFKFYKILGVNHDHGINLAFHIVRPQIDMMEKCVLSNLAFILSELIIESQIQEKNSHYTMSF